MLFSPPTSFSKIEAFLLIKYGDSLLSSEVFLVSAIETPDDTPTKNEPSVPNLNEAPTFSNTVFLPEWNITRKLNVT